MNRLGFNWDPRENYWIERFEELKEHFAKQSDKKNKKMPNRKTPLGVWCDGQVLEFNRFQAGQKPYYITKERIDLLNSIGFVWDRMLAAWMKNYEALKKFYEKYGHTQVSVNYGDKTLFRWLAKQKKKYKNGKEGKKPALTKEQIELLQEFHLFESGKRYSVHQRHRKEVKSSKSKGRPRSTTLIPEEARMVVALGSQAVTANSGNPSASTATPTTESGVARAAPAVTGSAVSEPPMNMQELSVLSTVNPSNLNELVPENMNAHAPVGEKQNVNYEQELNEPAEEVHAKMPAMLGTGEIVVSTTNAANPTTI